MTKRILQAIRDLPDEYVADGTELCEYNGWVVAVNGKACLPVIKHRPDSGWTKLELGSPSNNLDNRPNPGHVAPSERTDDR